MRAILSLILSSAAAEEKVNIYTILPCKYSEPSLSVEDPFPDSISGKDKKVCGVIQPKKSVVPFRRIQQAF